VKSTEKGREWFIAFYGVLFFVSGVGASSAGVGGIGTAGAGFGSALNVSTNLVSAKSGMNF
jgi:hypothetical protein